jgi:signal transduction histidine kinase
VARHAAARSPPAAPREARSYLETLDLLLDFPFAVAWFTLFTTLVTPGASLLITLVGLPILTLTFVAARYVARFERWRARILLGLRIGAAPATVLWNLAPAAARRAVPRPDDLEGARLRLAGRPDLRRRLLHRRGGGVVGAALAHHSADLRDRVAAGRARRLERLPHRHGARGLVAAAIGLVVLPLTPWVIRLASAGDAALVRWMLSPSRTDALEERVGELRETQARSVDIAMADRRQIERDLHDGAQQRLLALGMDLGMALEKFEDDPETARTLVGGAHEELQRAIVELRNLARGIHPAVLTDRGLDAALSSLAARSTVPVRLDVRLDRRPPASAEATAYFIVAEALANAVKHANANAVDVRVRSVGDKLSVVVADNGVGGAAEHPGGGLVGLADRASSVEGSFQISSPQGGPTILTAELPCAS